MNNSNTLQYKQTNFVYKVMNTIKGISALDHSPNYQQSKDYYAKHKTFDGIKEFLTVHNEIMKNYEK